MQQILARAQKLQAKVNETQKKLEQQEVSGSAGSGAVNIIVTIKGDVKSVSIKKEVIDPEEKEMLEDLIVAAFNDAKTKADSIYEKEMKEATGGLSIPGF